MHASGCVCLLAFPTARLLCPEGFSVCVGISDPLVYKPLSINTFLWNVNEKQQGNPMSLALSRSLSLSRFLALSLSLVVVKLLT